MRVRRVLFVCSGNTCRSPMAAALLRHLWEKGGAPWELEVLSAGTGAFPGLAATPYAVAAVAERGLDLSEHRSQAAHADLIRAVDLVLTMTQRHKEHLQMTAPDQSGKIHTLGEYAGYGDADIPDPFGGPMEAYRQTAGSLASVIRAVVERIQREERRA